MVVVGGCCSGGCGWLLWVVVVMIVVLFVSGNCGGGDGCSNYGDVSMKMLLRATRECKRHIVSHTPAFERAPLSSGC